MKTLLTLLASCLLAPLCVHAQKIVADPNAAQVSQSAMVETTDERLAQKITYQSTDKRLHTIITELSEKTGVVIYCGKDDEDWHVRDLPVVVSWKDMPLGKLLQVITYSTHTHLTSAVIDNAHVYRIVADEQAMKRLADSATERRKSLRDLASWTWDAWVAFGAVPDDSIKSAGVEGMKTGSGTYQFCRDLAQIISKLGPASKARVFAGEAITLTSADASFAQSLSELYSDWWSLQQEGYLQFVAENQDLIRENPELVIDEPRVLTQDELNKASLTFELRSGENPELVIKLDGPGGLIENPFPDPREWVSEYIPGLAKYPTMAGTTAGDPPSSFSDFDQNNPQSEAIAKTKVTLPKPADGREVCFADVLTALAEAGGYSIVCEDFRSHCEDPRLGAYTGFLGTEIGMSDILSELQSSGDTTKWYIDQRDKLIIGSSLAWYERHKRLVPESFFTYLLDKLNGSGADIDDAVAIRRLTDGQYQDWVRHSRDLKVIAWECMPRDEPVWRFYDLLSSQDKALAKSVSGLALSGFDAGLLTKLFEDVEQGVAEQDKWGMVSLAKSSPEFVKEHPELNGSTIIPTDPNILSQLTLYLRTQDIEPMTEAGINSKDVTKKRYTIEIIGEGIAMKFEGPLLDFPVYSKNRENNMRKENTEPAENKQ